MVGQAIERPVSNFRGVRPFNHARDLNSVTALLSHAFRDELDWPWLQVPILRDVASFLWASSYGPGLAGGLSGYVWEEGGQIIGNVTLTPDEGHPGTWLVSNVATADAHRRRGIARALMKATLEDVRARHGYRTILQVRPRNLGAIRLYEELGFESVDVMRHYRAPAVPPPANTEPLPADSLRRLTPPEYATAHQLALDAIDPRVKLLRPPRAAEFVVAWEDRLTERVLDFFSGQQTARWGYFAPAGSESASGRPPSSLQAVIAIRGQHLGTPHMFEIYIHPAARNGVLERTLVAFALSHLRRLPRRTVDVPVWTSHTQLVQALEGAGMHETRGLMLMDKEMSV